MNLRQPRHQFTADTPTDTPPATETSTPENSPTSGTNTFRDCYRNATETATVDLTSTITPTETATPTITPTLTPTETAAEENWRIEYDLFYPSALLASMGGEGAAEAELRSFLSILDGEQDVSYDLGITVEGEGGLFTLAIEGSGGLEQFRHVYLDILASRFGTISGITQLWISSSGKAISEWQLALDSNITTGYNWHLVDASGITVSSESYQDGASGEIGGVGRQYFTLENDGSGSYSISLKYSSPWEAGCSSCAPDLFKYFDSGRNQPCHSRNHFFCGFVCSCTGGTLTASIRTRDGFAWIGAG